MTDTLETSINYSNLANDLSLNPIEDIHCDSDDRQDVDVKEYLKIKNFITKECCKYGCFQNFDLQFISNIRDNLAELMKSEHDMLIMDCLSQHNRISTFSDK